MISFYYMIKKIWDKVFKNGPRLSSTNFIWFILEYFIPYVTITVFSKFTISNLKGYRKISHKLHHYTKIDCALYHTKLYQKYQSYEIIDDNAEFWFVFFLFVFFYLLQCLNTAKRLVLYLKRSIPASLEPVGFEVKVCGTEKYPLNKLYEFQYVNLWEIWRKLLPLLTLIKTTSFRALKMISFLIFTKL